MFRSRINDELFVAVVDNEVKFAVVTEEIPGTEHKVPNGETIRWMEQWKTYNTSGKVVDSYTVERAAGHNADDHWSICLDCGAIAWITNDSLCDPCRELEDIAEYKAQQSAKWARVLINNSRDRGPKGVAVV